MDEGFNTFINGVDTKVFNKGEFDEKQDVQRMAPYMFSQVSSPVVTTPDVIQPDFLGVAAYEKPAMGLDILRNQILGVNRFDYAFRTYIKRWAFKHPTPWDFFRTIESAAGEDLSWFWRGWFLNNWKLDQAVKEVKYVEGDTAKGALITIENLEEMALPVVLAIQESNGNKDTITLPAEIWQRGGTWTFKYKSTSAITTVIIDPLHVFPDINPSNNTWAGIPQKTVPPGVTSSDVISNYLTAIGGVNKLKTGTDLSLTATGTVQGIEIQMVSKHKLPDKYFTEVTVPAMNMVPMRLVVNGDSISMAQNGQVVPVTGDIKKGLQESLIIFPELALDDTAYSFQLSPVLESMNGGFAYVVTITSPSGNSTKNYYDEKTGLKIKEEPAGGGNTQELSDYRDVYNGIKFPFIRKTEANGQIIEFKVKEIKVNSGLADNEFK
jgi:hypothetical protein